MFMLRRKFDSVGYALRGLKVAYAEESNFQIQIVLAVLALLFGAYFNLSVIEWLFILCSTGLVLTAELINTALEELCDMLKVTHDPHVAKIKDIAAGAVLVASSTALLIGLVIFLPKFFAL